MWRIVIILATVLVVGDATGLIPEADEIGCADEADGKQCPPTCPTCTCAWHSLKTAPAPHIALTAIDLIERTVELPANRDGHGLLAPAPAHRPPIV
jgi:hypothetical protein